MNYQLNSLSNNQNTSKAECLIKKIRFQDKFKIDITKVYPKGENLNDYKITSYKNRFFNGKQNHTSFNYNKIEDQNYLRRNSQMKLGKSIEKVDRLLRSEYSNVDSILDGRFYRTNRMLQSTSADHMFKSNKTVESVYFKKFFENPRHFNESVPLNKIHKKGEYSQKMKTQKDFFKFADIIENIDNTKSQQINIKLLNPEKNLKKETKTLPFINTIAIKEIKKANTIILVNNKPILTFNDEKNNGFKSINQTCSENKDIKFKFYKAAPNKYINFPNLLYENASSTLLSKGNSIQVSLKNDKFIDNIKKMNIKTIQNN